MSANRAKLPLFAPLLRYPHPAQQAAADQAVAELADHAEVAHRLRGFSEFLHGHTQKKLQEKYTQTFEINPSVALEVGYHLFGLAYQRGQFLARAKQAADELGIETGTELADHLPTMLDLAAALDEETALSLIQEAIFPAVRHMAGGFDKTGTGFGQVVIALHQFLQDHYECIVYAPVEQAPEEEVSSHA
ncbi:MAG: molecular chaperone TorD family protein [Planctomycetes bacterium]|nr:molecular chaperone TorD family protein [Planctomycetota bacterium]